MSDYNTIEDLLASTSSVNENVLQLTDKQLKSMPDVNNGNYTAYIQFDTLNAATDLVVYKDAWVSIPLTIYPGGATPGIWTGTEPIACRGSALSFVNGLRLIEMVSNNELVNETSQLYYFNNERLLFERTRDWMETEASELLFAMPTPQYGGDIVGGGVYLSSFGNDVNVYNPIPATNIFVAHTSGGGVTTDAAAIPTADTGFAFISGLVAQSGLTLAQSSFSNLNTSYNYGFDQGVRFFKNNFKYTTGLTIGGVSGYNAYVGQLNIKLKYLHDIFDSVFSVPMKNVRFNFQLITAAQSTGAGWPWLVTGTSLLGPPGSGNAGDGYPLTQIGYGGQRQCQLYWENLTLPPLVYAKWAAEVEKGYFYKKSYRVTNPNTAPGLVNNTSSAQQITQLTTGIVSAQSVIWIATPTGWQNGPNAQWMNGFPTAPCAAIQTNLNVQVDNGNYIQQGINQPWEQWNYILEQFPNSVLTDGYTSLFTYNPMFLNYNRQVVVDISRQKNGKDPKLARALSMQWQNSSTAYGGVDVVVLIVSLNTVIFTFSKEKTLIQKFVGVA